MKKKIESLISSPFRSTYNLVVDLHASNEFDTNDPQFLSSNEYFFLFFFTKITAKYNRLYIIKYHKRESIRESVDRLSEDK